MSDQVKRAVGEVRKASHEQREESLALLVGMALAPETSSDAIDGLLRLCERKHISTGDLLPHEGTLLGLFRDALNQAKPLQGDPRKMEWIVDADYSPVRYRTGLLLDVIGYLPIESTGSVLRSAFEMADPRLRLIAALSLLRNLEAVDAAELEKIAASHEVRILLWEQLGEMQMESLMPEPWSTSDQLAASELSRWIAHPMELGTCPEEIELMGTFPVQIDDRVLDLFLFRFREFPKPWNPDEGWMAGIAGPYENGKFLRSCWSSFESWNARSPEEHVKKLIATVSGRCGEG